MKRSFSRPEKRFFAGCVVLMMGLVSWGRLRAQLNAEPIWAIPAPAPTPSPNGFDLYLSAQAAIIRARPPVDPRYDPKPVTNPKQSAARYSLARRNAWIQQNAPAWALFERAKAAQSLHPAMRELGKMFTGYGQFRELARSKSIIADTCKMRGDWQGAAQNGLDIIEMGGDIGRGASTIGFLVEMGVESIAELVLRDVPSHLDARQARQNARRLERLLQVRPRLAEVELEEKWVGLSALRDILHSGQLPDTFKAERDASWRERVGIYFLSRREVVENYTRAADWNIAVAKRPYTSAPAQPPVAGNVVNRTLNLNLYLANCSDARSQTQLSLLLLRLGLRAYRLENGAYPDTLNLLAPKYLAQIPRDAFGQNAPLHFRKTGDSYALWSIGPDQKDNGGQSIKPDQDAKRVIISADSLGDIVARP